MPQLLLDVLDTGTSVNEQGSGSVAKNMGRYPFESCPLRRWSLHVTHEVCMTGWQRWNVEPWDATASGIWNKKAAKGAVGFELRTPYVEGGDFGTSLYAQDYSYSDCPSKLFRRRAAGAYRHTR